MSETLLTQTSIKIYGRVINSLQYKDDTQGIGANNFLRNQLAVPAGASNSFIATTVAGNTSVVANAALGSSFVAGMLITGIVPGTGAAPTAVSQIFAPGTYVAAVTSNTNFTVSSPAATASAIAAIVATAPAVSLARIYGFSFEGAFYSMPKPALFTVHGLGTPVESKERRTSVDESGVIAREWEFAGQGRNKDDGAKDLVFWEYEKGDFSLRLDNDAGPWEQILLHASMRGGADRADRSGAGVSGAGVSGAGVSGAGVSGAGVSGAGVSGAGLRR